jgi:hypothetical protein
MALEVAGPRAAGPIWTGNGPRPEWLLLLKMLMGEADGEEIDV